MEDDGFTLVTGKKASKKSGLDQRYKKIEGNYERTFGTLEDVDLAMSNAKIGISKSGHIQWLRQKIENLLEKLAPNSKISKIFIIGNGHFDWSDEQGAHQLALFLEISQIFDSKIVFQEPNCSEAELEWLRTSKTCKNLEIRTNFDLKMDLIDENDPRNVSILGLIHGEHPIFHGLLHHNWPILEKNPRKLIVIGNDYGSMHWEMIRKIREENFRIDEFVEKSRIERFPERYETMNNAFRDTVIMSAKIE